MAGRPGTWSSSPLKSTKGQQYKIFAGYLLPHPTHSLSGLKNPQNKEDGECLTDSSTLAKKDSGLHT